MTPNVLLCLTNNRFLVLKHPPQTNDHAALADVPPVKDALERSLDGLRGLAQSGGGDNGKVRVCGHILFVCVSLIRNDI